MEWVARMLHESGYWFFHRGGTVSERMAATLFALLVLMVAPGVRYSPAQQAQSGSDNHSNNDELLRRAKNRVAPEYPDLARQMSITGVVKVEVVVSPNGTVKDARVVGGHPVLARSALDAAKRWRFEPAATESTGIIEFKFEPR
jgi:TonB family protein